MSVFDLLPIPSGIEQPTAYDVFGLVRGEPDLQKITSAVTATIDQLKLIKDQTDPKTWQQAARMVDQARQILADPLRKAALDAKLTMGRSHRSSDDDPSIQSSNPIADPLSGLLPAGNPLLPVSPAAPESDSISVDLPAGLFGTPAQAIDTTNRIPTADTPDPIVSVPLLEPVARSKKSSRPRRRSKSVGSWVVGLSATGLVITTASLAYFVFYGPGTVQIVTSNDRIVVSTGRDDDPPVSITAQPRPLDQAADRSSRPDQDPIMGALAEPKSNAASPEFSRPSGLTERSRGEELESRLGTMDSEKVDPKPTPAEPQLPMDPAPADPPMMDSDEQLKALEKVRNLVRAADWGQMKTAAEALRDMPLTNENAALAESLFQLTDLAIYYRQGIRLAIAELEVGNDFEVIDSFRVIVVDKGDDALTVRYNKKNRSFTLDEFPFSLAHKLATFQIPDTPSGQAAKAVYQAITPKATDAHRDQSIQWLAAIDGEVEGAHPKQLIETIQSIYPSVEP